MDRIAQGAENSRYLPDQALPQNLRYSADLSATLAGCDIALIVVPSHAFVNTVHAMHRLRPELAGIAWATKGFEPGSGRFLHEVVDEIYGPRCAQAVVTGPTFAREVAAGLPSALTVHGPDPHFVQRVAAVLHGPSMRAYSGDDIAGAELGGAMKNVLAVATGIADGMGLGLNARAGLITRGLNEMMRLNAAMGGRAETLMGLAGLGDLVLTCTGDLSRNRRLGLALGRGVSIEEAVAEIGQVVESVHTADEVMRLARRHQLDLPISAHVQAVLHRDITPQEGLKSLLSREQKPEYPQPLLGQSPA
jgi:glycerol-3-phosphate dehydrogenase (NAD(P)+)